MKGDIEESVRFIVCYSEDGMLELGVGCLCFWKFVGVFVSVGLIVVGFCGFWFLGDFNFLIYIFEEFVGFSFCML